jgi:hypothetical protein
MPPNVTRALTEPVNSQGRIAAISAKRRTAALPALIFSFLLSFLFASAMLRLRDGGVAVEARSRPPPLILFSSEGDAHDRADRCRGGR